VVQLLYQLSLDLRRSTACFPRIHRYSLGQLIADQSSLLLTGAVEINALADNAIRTQNLRSLLAKLLDLRLHLRMAQDLHCISKGRFRSLSLVLDDIQRQLTGWYKWAKSQ